MYLLGFDAGTSSVKATLMDVDSQAVVASATCPKKEMPILAPQPGWAEQHPEDWWANVKAATAEILATANIDPAQIKAIGITYQMHGLVCVDKNKNVLRPSIIWCDSRAVEVGRRAAEKIGPDKCLKRLLNHPGNFTAAKLGWVKENEPDIYRKIDKIMLPGDYIAMKMTDRIATTFSGLSEGIFWDFKKHRVSDMILDSLDIPLDVLPPIFPTFYNQGELTSAAAAELGLKAGTPIAYRAGDQPNNAFSLNVLNPGEIAATAGTSGVVYGIGDEPNYDSQSRVNTFLHVNHSKEAPRYGVLLCLNGTGILNSWLKHNVIAPGEDYPQMNEAAAAVPVGAEGLSILPFGNGSERILENRNLGASVHGLNFNVHTQAHLLRAAQEGIVFALNYGLDIMRDMGIRISAVRAGKANMFLSPLFASAFATVTDTTVYLYDTDGSQGAARGAGLGAGIYKSPADAFAGLKQLDTIEPDASNADTYAEAYRRWKKTLKNLLKD
ncbi:MAG: carbohydrate kinase [Sedimentisphaerales bacterium]|nr:carbohydrate kinase [Sedimentisphaerales bacterium]